MAVPQVAIDAVTHYLGKGLTKDIAVGIVSVLYAGESKLNPGSQGAQSTETPGALNPSGAFGVASWNGARQAALGAFAKLKGELVASVDTQLDFVLTEIADSFPKIAAAIWPNGLGKPIGSITYQDFIPLFVDSYEIPAEPQAEIARSLAFAEQLYPAAPASAPVSAPAVQTPAPQAIGAPLDPAALIALAGALSPFAPVIESVLAGLVGGVVKQMVVNLPTLLATPAPAAPVAPPAAAIEQIVAEVLKQLQPKAS